MLTDEQLHAIMPGLPRAKRDTYLPFLERALSEFAIDSAARRAAFLAQLAHESGQLRFMEELWGPTSSQQRYEPPTTLATRLGNTEPGDGKRFKGRGPIQITGRANYRRYGDLLHIDLVSNPAMAALPDLAFRIAGLFWMKNGLNELADQASAAAFKQITRRINGGFNGLSERERFYAVARTTLGVPAEVTGGVSRERTIPSAPSVEAFERGAEAIEMASRRESKTTAKPARRKVKSALSVGRSAETKRKTASRLKSKSTSKRNSKPDSTARPTRTRPASRTPPLTRRAASPPPAGKRRASASASRMRPRRSRKR